MKNVTLPFQMTILIPYSVFPIKKNLRMSVHIKGEEKTIAFPHSTMSHEHQSSSPSDNVDKRE